MNIEQNNTVTLKINLINCRQTVKAFASFFATMVGVTTKYFLESIFYI